MKSISSVFPSTANRLTISERINGTTKTQTRTSKNHIHNLNIQIYSSKLFDNKSFRGIIFILEWGFQPFGPLCYLLEWVFIDDDIFSKIKPQNNSTRQCLLFRRPIAVPCGNGAGFCSFNCDLRCAACRAREWPLINQWHSGRRAGERWVPGSAVTQLLHVLSQTGRKSQILFEIYMFIIRVEKKTLNTMSVLFVWLRLFTKYECRSCVGFSPHGLPVSNYILIHSCSILAFYICNTGEQVFQLNLINSARNVFRSLCHWKPHMVIRMRITLAAHIFEWIKWKGACEANRFCQL